MLSALALYLIFLNLYHAVIPVSFFVHIKVFDAKVLCYVTVFFLKCNLRIAKSKFFRLHVTNVKFFQESQIKKMTMNSVFAHDFQRNLFSTI